MTYYAAACCCEEPIGCVDPQTGEWPTCLDFDQELYIVVEGTAFWSYQGEVERKIYGIPVCEECRDEPGCNDVPQELNRKIRDTWTQEYRKTGSVIFKALMQVFPDGSASLVTAKGYEPVLQVAASGFEKLENEYELNATRCNDGLLITKERRNNFYRSEYPDEEIPEIVNFDLRRTVVYKTCEPPNPSSLYEQITYCENEYLEEGCHEKWSVVLDLRLQGTEWQASIDEVRTDTDPFTEEETTVVRGGTCDLICSEIPESACPIHSHRTVSYARIPFGGSICPQPFRRPVDVTENLSLNWIRPPFWIPGETNECEAVDTDLCRGEDVHWFALDPDSPYHYGTIDFYNPSLFVVVEYCGEELFPTGGWKPLYHWSRDCRGVVSGEVGGNTTIYGEENIFVCKERGTCLRCGSTGNFPPQECKTCTTGLDRSMDIDCAERFSLTIPRHDLIDALPSPTDWPTNV